MNRWSDKQELIATMPVFQSGDEERRFWAGHDSSDYVDWTPAESVVIPLV